MFRVNLNHRRQIRRRRFYENVRKNKFEQTEVDEHDSDDDIIYDMNYKPTKGGPEKKKNELKVDEEEEIDIKMVGKTIWNGVCAAYRYLNKLRTQNLIKYHETNWNLSSYFIEEYLEKYGIIETDTVLKEMRESYDMYKIPLFVPKNERKCKEKVVYFKESKKNLHDFHDEHRWKCGHELVSFFARFNDEINCVSTIPFVAQNCVWKCQVAVNEKKDEAEEEEEEDEESENDGDDKVVEYVINMDHIEGAINQWYVDIVIYNAKSLKCIGWIKGGLIDGRRGNDESDMKNEFVIEVDEEDVCGRSIMVQICGYRLH